MPPLSEFIPHRELPPARYCADCKAQLSSFNETSTCWQCDPTWLPHESYIGKVLHDQIGDAIDRILAGT